MHSLLIEESKLNSLLNYIPKKLINMPNRLKNLKYAKTCKIKLPIFNHDI